MKKVFFAFLAVSVLFVFSCCAPTESDTRNETTTETETAADLSGETGDKTSESKIDFPEIDLSKIETTPDNTDTLVNTETDVPVNTESSKVDDSFIGEEGELTPDDDDFGG